MARKPILFAALLGLFAIAIPKVHADQAGIIYPAGTSVAVIVINDTSEKNDDLKTSETQITQKEITDEFTAHGFTIVDPAKVTVAIGTLDMSDEENETKANLYNIASACNAQLIILAALQDNGQQKTVTLFDDLVYGWVNTKFWLLDATAHKPIVNAKTFKGDSRHHEFGYGLTAGSQMQKNGAANAVRLALQDFFKLEAPK